MSRRRRLAALTLLSAAAVAIAALVRWAQAATGQVPAALVGGRSLPSFLRGVTCLLESQPMPQVASIWERPAQGSVSRCPFLEDVPQCSQRK